MKRCKWCNIKNKLYVDYHDKEWGRQNFNDKYLFEMLVLESFQAGLSWECVLNKRENLRKAFDDFKLEKICNYNDEKILVVTHGGVIYAIYRILGLKVKTIENLEMVTIEY